MIESNTAWEFDKNEPILIWGAGAIGGTLGASFAAAGYPVHFVDVDKEHVNALNTSGIRIEGAVREMQQKVKAFLPQDVKKTYKLAFLAVKAHHTKDAIAELAPHLALDGAVVSAQNGLNELTIADTVGYNRTVGCFLNYSADYISPGLVRYDGRAAVVVGELNGSVSTKRIEFIYSLLKDFDADAILTPNIWGYLWGKMVYGAMLYATALTDAPIWECLGNEDYMDVFVALGREIAAVAEADGVHMEGFNGFNPLLFTADAEPQAAFESMRAMSKHNKTSAKAHSGIWRDLAVRKRKTEVDAQLCPIPQTAVRHGMQTPLTLEIIRLIHACEEGLERSWENLDLLRHARQG